MSQNETQLPARGCVDRSRDSAGHRADLSTFTPFSLETQEEREVAQMSVSVNTQRELKGGSGGRGATAEIVWTLRNRDIFQFKAE